MTNVSSTTNIDPKNVYAGIEKPGDRPGYTNVDVDIDLGLTSAADNAGNVDTFTATTNQTQEQLESGKDQVGTIVDGAGQTQGSISAAQGQIDENLSQIGAQVETLNAYSDELAAWSEALSNGYTEVGNYIQNLDAQMGTLTSQIGTIDGKLSTIEGQISEAEKFFGIPNFFAQILPGGKEGISKEQLSNLKTQKNDLLGEKNGIENEMNILDDQKAEAQGVQRSIRGDQVVCRARQTLTNRDLEKAEKNEKVNKDLKASLVSNLSSLSELIASGEVKISDYEEVIRKVMEENNRQMSDEDVTKLAQAFFDSDLSVEDIEDASEELANGGTSDSSNPISGIIDRGSQYMEASSDAYEKTQNGEGETAIDPITGEKLPVDPTKGETNVAGDSADDDFNYDAILAIGLSEENHVPAEIAAQKVEFFNMVAEYKDLGISFDFASYVNTPKHEMNEMIEQAIIKDIINTTSPVTATSTITTKKDLETNNEAAASLLSVNYAIQSFLAQNPSVTDIAAEGYLSTVEPVIQGITKGNIYDTAKLSQLASSGSDILASLQSKITIGNDEGVSGDSAFSALSLKVNARIASMESENESENNGYSFGALTGVNSQKDDVAMYRERVDYYVSSYKNAASASERAIAYAGLEMIWERMQNEQGNNKDPYHNDEQYIYAIA